MIRNPMHAGTFYPRFEQQIKRQIEGWISNAVTPLSSERALGVILPHAGYMYSGECATLGLYSISHENIDSFIILHPSHQANYFDFSVSPYQQYVNPLGTLDFDMELYNKIAPAADQNIPLILHQEEHSMEIQLPILNYFFPKAKILPIMFGNQIPAVAKRLAEILYETIYSSTKRIVILCSSDLSHYHRARIAEEMDSELIKNVIAIDPEHLWQGILHNNCEACGIGGILCLLYYAQCYTNAKMKVIQYTHSGKISGNDSQVVGYLSAKLYI
ncbi:MAG TPA: AmmeMemoRadiSam system protein B [Candidatus Cloacimonas sp.]|jgi:AmmeMemoRadiSam system protein B|nr:AmmeMemoRadiSam system protein B [Candidatus Cloacimonas sp.]HNQ39844.1 AmmeMemoRadiSam system protein B [Candidatus Cloacimonas sp.]HNS84845.1 AmmeMemoRadiSam system protein B [Candidatus Cloacimonas sp.]HQC31717.1 AmmeMemoRadiSam system protein B [Candidatus Cloacimonas sp.]HQM03526.1 AmmeMemoRadiSam system protein B [Candidatus Cloacimonas sp.]